MITWNEFERQQPALAGTGRTHLYQSGIGLAFLATVRPDGGPRVHPVCPVISPAGLHVLIIAGPKQDDLRRDGVTRCTANQPAAPPGRRLRPYRPGHRVADPEVSRVVRGQCWPSATARSGLDEEVIFELGIKTCLLMLTQDGEAFPAGPTIWKAGLLGGRGIRNAADGSRSDKVT